MSEQPVDAEGQELDAEGQELLLIEKPPSRISELLRNLGIRTSDVVVMRKSALKVNDTLPTMWIVSTWHELLLCSTHRTRGLWKRLTRQDINAVIYEVMPTETPRIRIVFNDESQDDLFIPLPSGVSEDEGKLIASLLPASTGLQ
jgi:hypothetical protein